MGLATALIDGNNFYASCEQSLDPRPGQVVVAVLDGAFTLKRLMRHRGRLRLEAAHPDYPPLELHRCGEVQIWGVAIHVIHPL